MGVLIIDVGTSGARAAIVEPDGRLHDERARRLPPDTPFPGLVEFDPEALAAAALELATAVIEAVGIEAVEGVGLTNQRASTILWDSADDRVLGPGLGWQDLRTAGDCLTLQADGLRLAPNQSATKLAHLLAQPAAAAVPASRLRFGTVDTWLAWRLTGGRHHVTDLSNAAVTGMLRADGSDWDDAVLQRLSIPRTVLPAVVDSAGVVGEASALPGAPPLAGLIGDQQASLVGQGGTRRGVGKITFGTGGMLDVFLGAEPPAAATRQPHGTFPIAVLRRGGQAAWGVEAILLTAGSCIDWLRDDLRIIDTAAASDTLAASVAGSDGVVFVPYLLGEGTPGWDLGARGTRLGVTRGTDRGHVCRAVLEGVAHAGADLVQAAEDDTGVALASLRVDGGMSANATFVAAWADAVGRPVEVSREREATAVGAGLVAGLGLGWFGDSLDDLAALWRPAAVVEPSADTDRRAEARARWQEARTRAAAWYPELTALQF
jgi:glycerol kinase